MSDKSPLVSKDVLRDKCQAEGIDHLQVCVFTPCWNESAILVEGVLSALVRCDLVIRSDGSVVFLDSNMAADSLDLASDYLSGKSNPDNLPWEKFIKKVTRMPDYDRFPNKFWNR